MKLNVLNMLRSTGGNYISGEYLSQQLGVSRSAIWKHIQVLRKEGFLIESVTNKGYRLMEMSHEMSQTALDALVSRSTLLGRAYFLETVDSTNQMAKRIAMENPDSTALIVAREQTSGKGRRGRHWVSEKDSGLWMSLLIRPKISPELVAKFTLISAAAVCTTLEKITGLKLGIKWPNDIVFKGKKLSGILTELSAEPGFVNYLVVGVGINTNATDFNSELADKASSLKVSSPTVEINHLNIVKTFVEQFEMYYNQFVDFDRFDQVLEINRQKSVTLNQWVEVSSNEVVETVYAKDIDQDGSLIVLDQNQTEKKVYYGEVSVRGVNGYI